MLALVIAAGINCSLGVYRSGIRNPIERFRLRATATLLFVFAGMLMWIRAGTVARVGNRASGRRNRTCARLWIEHLIGMPSPSPEFVAPRPLSWAPAQPAERSPTCCSVTRPVDYVP